VRSVSAASVREYSMAHVSKPTYRVVDVGPLDRVIKFTTKVRYDLGISTRCARCRKEIEDEFFYGGFKKGHPNMLFHWKCLDPEDREKIDE
jgi:hypothetical protein